MNIGSRQPLPPISNADEEAARWLVQMEARPLGARDVRRLERWLAADPVHQAAFERAQAACDLAHRHAAAAAILEMRAAALAARGKSRARPWGLVAGIAAGAVAVGALWLVTHSIIARVASHPVTQRVARVADGAIVPPIHYATAVGERSSIALPDGSVATLDTNSSLDVAYSDVERGIHLTRGQALFEVAKHQTTPFQVYAGGRRITAVGTTFNVRVDGHRLRVALIEGKIRVSTMSTQGTTATPAQQVTLVPGDVLEANAAAPMTVAIADVERSASWRDGVAVFVDSRLADAVAEMNRYTLSPITILDPAAGEYRVSGVFKTGDPEQFANSVATVFPLTIAHTASGSVVLQRRSP
jgi:transmembrane sensor